MGLVADALRDANPGDTNCVVTASHVVARAGWSSAVHACGGVLNRCVITLVAGALRDAALGITTSMATASHIVARTVPVPQVPP